MYEVPRCACIRRRAEGSVLTAIARALGAVGQQRFELVFADELQQPLCATRRTWRRWEFWSSTKPHRQPKQQSEIYNVRGFGPVCARFIVLTLNGRSRERRVIVQVEP